MFAVPALAEEDERVLQAVKNLRADLSLNLTRRRRWEGALRRQSQALAAQGSNSIEGIDVDKDAALEIISGEGGGQAGEAWLAVKGYSDAMTYCRILGEQPSFDIDETLVRSLHFMVQNYDLDRSPGVYRTSDVYVVDESTKTVTYEGPPADQVEGLMGAYVENVATLNDEGVDAIIQGAMAHLNLVMIHPFRDGNGRISRVMQSLLLYRGGVDEAQFVSIEEYLGRHTREYYDVLADAGGGHWDPTRDASLWIRFVLTAHYRQAHVVARRLWELSEIGALVDRLIEEKGLPERSVPAIELTMSGWKLRNATYRHLADVSANVASRELNQLVAAGVLQKEGAKRGAWYRPAEEWTPAIRTISREAGDKYPRSPDPYALLATGEDLG